MKKREALKLLDEAVGLLSVADFDGIRARGVDAPEDSQIMLLCERLGYGAVMDSAARQWYMKTAGTPQEGASHTTGHCATTIKNFLNRVNEAKNEE